MGRYQTDNTLLCYYGFVAMGTDANDKKKGTPCIFFKALHKYSIYSCIPGVWEKEIQRAYTPYSTAYVCVGKNNKCGILVFSLT